MTPTDLDTLNVHAQDRNALERVDPKFVFEKLHYYQNKTWEVFSEIRKNLVAGLTENEARKLGMKTFESHGVTKHWHKVYIRFGAGTALTFNEPLQEEYRLKSTDAVYLDLGPVWQDAETGLSFEGDVGDTFAFGENSEVEKCAKTARDLFTAAQKEWREKKLTGVEIYNFLAEQTRRTDYLLTESVKGHRTSDFPHHRYSKQNLADITSTPSPQLWVLEVHIKHPSGEFGAFFEDIL